MFKKIKEALKENRFSSSASLVIENKVQRSWQKAHKFFGGRIRSHLKRKLSEVDSSP